MNAVEHEPVPTRVLNSTASEASYKPKQRSYGKTKLKKIKKTNWDDHSTGGISWGDNSTGGSARVTILQVIRYIYFAYKKFVFPIISQTSERFILKILLCDDQTLNKDVLFFWIREDRTPKISMKCQKILESSRPELLMHIVTTKTVNQC